MMFARLLFVCLFLVTIEPSFEARAKCPGQSMLCGTICGIEPKTNECYFIGPCDKKDGGHNYGDMWL